MEILKDVDKAAELVRRRGTSPRGSVVIGLPTSVAFALAVPLLEAVRF